MKIACTLMLGLMLLFAAAQYNDPDGLLWAALYAVPAAAMAVAATRPALLATSLGRALLALALAGLALAAAIAWPEPADFWRRSPWWEHEAAREASGLLIALVVTAAALPFARRSRSAGPSVRSAPGRLP